MFEYGASKEVVVASEDGLILDKKSYSYGKDAEALTLTRGFIQKDKVYVGGVFLEENEEEEREELVVSGVEYDSVEWKRLT